MGEMADYFLEEVMDMEYLRLDYRCGRLTDEDAYDLGIIDEHGGMYIANRPTLHGPSECPKCGAQTVLKAGKHGQFRGCSQFPGCNGSRGL